MEWVSDGRKEGYWSGLKANTRNNSNNEIESLLEKSVKQEKAAKKFLQHGQLS